MVSVNHKDKSLDQDAAEGMTSLLQQGGAVLVCFVAMLFVTGGAPSGLAVGLTVGLSGIFVTWNEQHRLIHKNNKDSRPRKTFPILQQENNLIGESLSEGEIASKHKIQNWQEQPELSVEYLDLDTTNLGPANEEVRECWISEISSPDLNQNPQRLIENHENFPVILNLGKELAVCYIAAMLLEKGTSYGNELLQHIAINYPMYRLSDSVLYSALKFLEDEDIIEGYWQKVEGRGRPRRMYFIKLGKFQIVRKISSLWHKYLSQSMQLTNTYEQSS